MTIDTDILGLLDASPKLFVFDYETGDEGVSGSVYDGFVEVDETEKVILVPLPYIVFWSTPGYDNNERFCGSVGDRVNEFQLTGVGEDRTQAKWVLDQARAVLSRKRLNGALIRRSDDNQLVRRNDNFTHVGGGPLFFGVDRYAVSG